MLIEIETRREWLKSRLQECKNKMDAALDYEIDGPDLASFTGLADDFREIKARLSLYETRGQREGLDYCYTVEALREYLRKAQEHGAPFGGSLLRDAFYAECSFLFSVLRDKNDAMLNA